MTCLSLCSVNGVVESSSLCVNPKMVPPSLEQARILRQIVLAGCSDHVARWLSLLIF